MDPQVNTGTDLTATASSVYGDAYKAADKFDKQTEEGIKKMDSEKVPKPPELAEAPKPENRSSMEAFGSAAGFLATFGSLMTRRPFTNALQSGAAVMNAYHAQDAKAFKDAMDKFKIDNDNAWKLATYNQDLYKDIIGKDEAQLRARAVSAKDEVMIHMADAKMGEQLQRDRDKQIEKGRGANQAIINYVEAKEEDAKEHGLSNKDIDMARPKWFGEALQNSKGTSITGDKIDFSSLKPNDIVPGTGITLSALDQKVETMHTKGSYPSAGVSMRSTKNPLKDALDNRWNEKYPDDNAGEVSLQFGEKQKELASNAARTASAKAAVKEMDHLGGPMIDAMKKLDPSEYPDWNSVKNAYDKKTGGPDVIKAFQAVQDFKTAFVSLMVKNGVPTDSARATSDDIASINFSLDQIEGVRDQAKITGAAVLDALADTKEGIIGGKDKSSNSPETKTIDGINYQKIDGKWHSL